MHNCLSCFFPLFNLLYGEVRYVKKIFSFLDCIDMVISICAAAFLVLFTFYVLKKDNERAAVYFGLSLFTILCLVFDCFNCSPTDSNFQKRSCAFFVSITMGVVGTRYFLKFARVFVCFINSPKKIFGKAKNICTTK